MNKRDHRDRSRREEQQRRAETAPIWRNTRPRANPETHRGDLERSVERFEAVLGR